MKKNNICGYISPLKWHYLMKTKNINLKNFTTMFDLNKTLYTLKKMIKSSDTATLNAENASKFMRQIVSFAKENRLKNIEKLCWSVVSKIGCRKPTCTIIHDLETIQRQLLTVKEKTQVMNHRENAARHYYYRSMNTASPAHHELALYDIVRVPTQGGMHLSVVTKIGSNNIECLPITTATPDQLRMIGRKYYPLGQTSVDGRPLYLTNSMTTIPLHVATRSYVRSYEDPATINSALHMLMC